MLQQKSPEVRKIPPDLWLNGAQKVARKTTQYYCFSHFNLQIFFFKILKDSELILAVNLIKREHFKIQPKNVCAIRLNT